MMVERIDEYLRDLADRQELIARASADMPRFWREVQEEEDEQWAFGVADLRSELGSQMLCFRSGAFNLDAPYIATNLQLFAFKYRVGWYERLTALDGDVVREDGRIRDDFYSEGRAAFLIDRARGRGDEDRGEWIGLVGLRSIPGSNFFPPDVLGGFTTTLALALDEDEYQERVEGYFAGLGAEVESIEDVEPLSVRVGADAGLEDEIFELAAGLSDSIPVAHASTIYSYTSQGEDDEHDENGYE